LYISIISDFYPNLIIPNQHSYDAAEDNEISFREGDRIVEIEAASEDWWQGKDKNGNVGLFPGESCIHSVSTGIR
jgi:hypothetical protein